jgi:hypothetical protein
MGYLLNGVATTYLSAFSGTTCSGDNFLHAGAFVHSGRERVLITA